MATYYDVVLGSTETQRRITITAKSKLEAIRLVKSFLVGASGIYLHGVADKLLEELKRRSIKRVGWENSTKTLSVDIYKRWIQG